MKPVPMLDLKLEYEYMKDEIDAAIGRCLEHQKWIFGPEIRELEDKIATYIGTGHCIGCSSGTEALVLSLRALALKLKGREYFEKTDEIITTSFTFTATGDAILRSGATPVFVDIDPAAYNIDPAGIREYIKSEIRNPKSEIVGIIPVHLYGLSSEMDEIMKIAAEHNLFVIEDVAQAFGGSWKGRKLGSIGTAGCFSFFPSKNLGGFGDGGMVSTNNEEIADIVRMLIKHGGKDKYNVDHIGYNGRLDTLQAAILLAKLKYIDEFNERRKNIAGFYNEALKKIEGLVLPAADGGHVFHQYTVRLLNGKRDLLQKFLKDEGISTMVYYPMPLHKMKVFDGRCKTFGELRESEKAVGEVLSLPIEPLMDEAEMAEVVTSAAAFFF
jgi:dTDP-4-amino-4,6-dideoxygalactose transaminase